MCKIIDIHTHIHSETDDGAREQGIIQLIEQAAAQGITGMIATPHFSRHQSVSSLRRNYQSSGEVEKTQSRFSIISRTENFYHEELTERLDRSLTMARKAVTELRTADARCPGEATPSHHLRWRKAVFMFWDNKKMEFDLAMRLTKQ